mmetsp:Transcript_62915/g.140091  ORF Transcript_62915/g.140091 Transcript_62915/m.140091 type:complete len:233 (+) Transcript_62915:107-805(+)
MRWHAGCTVRSCMVLMPHLFGMIVQCPALRATQQHACSAPAHDSNGSTTTLTAQPAADTLSPTPSPPVYFALEIAERLSSFVFRPARLFVNASAERSPNEFAGDSERRAPALPSAMPWSLRGAKPTVLGTAFPESSSRLLCCAGVMRCDVSEPERIFTSCARSIFSAERRRNEASRTVFFSPMNDTCVSSRLGLKLAPSSSSSSSESVDGGPSPSSGMKPPKSSGACTAATR